MIGLIQKDFYIIKSELRYFLLLQLCACCLRNNFLYAFSVVYAAFLPITALSYDERAKWNRLADMLPFSASRLVGSKYLIGYLSIASSTLILIFSRFLFFNYGKDDPSGSILILLVASCSGLIVLALQLPFAFLFGTEKGRLVFSISIMLFACITAFSSSIIDRINLPIDAGLTTLLLLLFIAAAVANLISFTVSKAVYERSQR